MIINENPYIEHGIYFSSLTFASQVFTLSVPWASTSSSVTLSLSLSLWHWHSQNPSLLPLPRVESLTSGANSWWTKYQILMVNHDRLLGVKCFFDFGSFIFFVPILFISHRPIRLPRLWWPSWIYKLRHILRDYFWTTLGFIWTNGTRASLKTKISFKIKRTISVTFLLIPSVGRNQSSGLERGMSSTVSVQSLKS